MAEKKSEKASPALKAADIEKKIVELGKQNIPPERIGLILRDQHGVPKAKLYGMKIRKVLKKHDVPITSDHENTKEKSDRLKKHFTKHKHDYNAKRLIMKYAGKLHKLKKQAA